MAEPLDRCEDLVGGFCPFEWLRVFVVDFNKAHYVGFEVLDRGMGAASELLSGKLREPSFDLVDP